MISQRSLQVQVQPTTPQARPQQSQGMGSEEGTMTSLNVEMMQGTLQEQKKQKHRGERQVEKVTCTQETIEAKQLEDFCKYPIGRH